MIATIALAASLVFPNVQARDMTGKTFETQSRRGTPVVYVVGFTHEQKSEAHAWRQALTASTGGALATYEMPVLSGMGIVMRPVIENSMTRKTPEAERPFVLTTTDRDVLVKGLQVSDPDRASVVTLVDAQGSIRFVGRGAPTPEAEAALLGAWRQLQGGN
jgi:hypothetical protein